MKIERSSELNKAVHMFCLPSGYCGPEPGTVLALYCMLVFHWAGVGVILFSRIVEHP